MRTLICCGLIFAVISWSSSAEETVVRTEKLSSPPEGEALFSFTNEQYEGAYTWSGALDSWRDIGMSFRVPMDGELSRITLSILMVPRTFLSPAPFRLQIFETQDIGEKPDSGKEIFSGRGELLLEDTDRDTYLSFLLPEPVAVNSQSFYTFLLSFEDRDDSHAVVFRTNLHYTAGRLWIRDVQNQDELIFLSQADHPGWLLYLH